MQKLSGLSKPQQFLVLLVVLAIVGYLLQLRTPLRINTDVEALLSLGASLADGKPYLYLGEPTHFPKGYPLLIAGLDRLQIANTFTFVGMNIAAVALSVWAAFKLLAGEYQLPRTLALGICAVMLFSWCLIKHVTLAQSDVVYIGFSLATCYSISVGANETTRRRWLFLGISVVLVTISISMRIVGIALVPALAWACLGGYRSILLNALNSKRGLLVIVPVVLAGLVTAAALATQTRYGREFSALYQETGIGKMLEHTLLVRAEETGSLIANFPNTKTVLGNLQILRIAGAVCLALIFYGIWRRRRIWSTTDVYGITYLAIILIWPYEDPRFLLPLLPIMGAWLAVAVLPWVARKQSHAWLAYAMLFWFAVTGIMAMAFSTQISWATTRFPELYAGGRQRPIYAAARHGIDPNTLSAELVDAAQVVVRYEPRSGQLGK